MKKTYFIDTGPLVAFFNERDKHHEWINIQLQQLTPPIYTCEPVLAECCFLLEKYPAAHLALFQMLEKNILTINFQLKNHIADIKKLIKRYKDIPISLADACLVKASEINNNAQIITCDSDFRIYRRNGREIIPTIMPS